MRCRRVVVWCQPVEWAAHQDCAKHLVLDQLVVFQALWAGPTRASKSNCYAIELEACFSALDRYTGAYLHLGFAPAGLRHLGRSLHDIGEHKTGILRSVQESQRKLLCIKSSQFCFDNIQCGLRVVKMARRFSGLYNLQSKAAKKILCQHFHN
jgi:hypothetical protein